MLPGFALSLFSFFFTQGWIQRALLSHSPWKTSCRLLRGCSHQSLSRSSSGTNSSSKSLLPADKAQESWNWRSKGMMELRGVRDLGQRHPPAIFLLLLLLLFQSWQKKWPCSFVTQSLVWVLTWWGTL